MVSNTLGQLKEKCSDSIKNWSFCGTVLSLFPILKWLPNYKIKEDLPGDIAAGLTLGIMNIPQGLAFALLASLPAITGLYVALFPVLVYAVMGTSKHLSVGTFAVISIMVANVIDKKTADFQDPPVNGTSNSSSSSTGWTPLEEEKIAISVTLCVVIGIIQVAMGVLRLGFITIFLSDSVVSGFTTGAGCWVFTSQIKHVIGIYPKTDWPVCSLVQTYFEIFKTIAKINFASAIIGILCILILLFFKHINEKYKLRFPIPAELIVVALATGISYGVNMEKKFDIKIVKSVPLGMPPLSVPRGSLMSDLVMDGFVISIVAFAINFSLGKLFAQKNGYTLDSNQELIAYGMQNFVSGFFSCFASSANLGRSLIQENIGKSQLCNVISSVIILLVLLLLAPLFEPLPKAVLGAIILVAIRRVFLNFLLVKKIWKVNKIDSVTWVVTWAAVVLLRIDLGLVVGVVFHMMSVVYRVSRPSLTIIGASYEKGGVYDDVNKEEEEKLSGVLIARFHSPLCFINAALFKDRLRKLVLGDKTEDEMKINCTHPSCFSEKDKLTKNRKKNNYGAESCLNNLSASSENSHLNTVHSVIVDCASFSFIDSTAVKTLNQIAKEFELQSIKLYLVNYTDAIYGTLKNGSVSEDIIILETLPLAVQHANERRDEQITDFMSAEAGDSKV